MPIQKEFRYTLVLASIFAFRMLGLFMILPVFSVYAQHLQHANPTLIGLAIGIYGLTQAILQIPFGYWSDKYGRKPMIITGLIIFALGSIIAAYSTHIEGVIVGRALQGAGAIGSCILAFIADLTPTRDRTKAMALTGIIIGLSFSVAMIIGPMLNPWIHVNGLFWLTAALAISGIFMLFALPPSLTQLNAGETSVKNARHSYRSWATFKHVLNDKHLQFFYFSIFCIHFLMTANFVVIPLLVKQLFHYAAWYLYLPVFILSAIGALFILRVSEHNQHTKYFIFATGIFFIIAQLLMAFNIFQHWIWLSVSLFLFFVSFNFYEALIPSAVSKIVAETYKGSALGIYSTCQFSGIFVGGIIGGWMYGHLGMQSLFIFLGLFACFWLLVAAKMRHQFIFH